MCGVRLLIYSQNLTVAPLKFGMDKQFHHTLYWMCDYLFMPELKLIHVSERGPECHQRDTCVTQLIAPNLETCSRVICVGRHAVSRIYTIAIFIIFILSGTPRCVCAHVENDDPFPFLVRQILDILKRWGWSFTRGHGWLERRYQQTQCKYIIHDIYTPLLKSNRNSFCTNSFFKQLRLLLNKDVHRKLFTYFYKIYASINIHVLLNINIEYIINRHVQFSVLVAWLLPSTVV